MRHHRLDKAGIRTGIACTGAGAQADTVVAHLCAQRIQEGVIQKGVREALGTLLRGKLRGYRTKQDALAVLDADFHSLKVVGVFVHNAGENLLTGKARAQLCLNKNHICHAGAELLGDVDHLADGKRQFLLNHSSDIAHWISLLFAPVRIT